MAEEMPDCTDDCPLLELCREKADTVEFALAGVESIKQQTDDITVSASEAINLTQEFRPAIGDSGVSRITRINLSMADKTLDVAADEDQLMLLLANDLRLWRTVIATMRERCEGTKRTKRFKLFGQATLRCSLEPAEVIEILGSVRERLFIEATAEEFGNEAAMD